MSDRTSGQVVVYDCPEDPELRNEVVDLLHSEGLSLEFMGIVSDERPTLALFTPYGDSEASLGMAEEVSAKLIERFPQVTFEAYTDPKYEYDGHVVLYAPDLGRFDARCGPDGDPLFTGTEIANLMKEHGDSHHLRRALGLPWSERLAAPEGERVGR